MQTIRALAFTVLFYGWTTLLGIAVLPVLLGPPRAILGYGRFWVQGAFVILRITVGINHQVRGQHLLPEGPVILAMKTPIGMGHVGDNLLARDPAIVLKKELLQIPVFGWCLSRVRPHRRRSPGRQRILKADDGTDPCRVAEGRPIVIYPEGTRTRPGTRQPYHAGIAALYGALDFTRRAGGTQLRPFLAAPFAANEPRYDYSGISATDRSRPRPEEVYARS